MDYMYKMRRRPSSCRVSTHLPRLCQQCCGLLILPSNATPENLPAHLLPSSRPFSVRSAFFNQGMLRSVTVVVSWARVVVAVYRVPASYRALRSYYQYSSESYYVVRSFPLLSTCRAERYSATARLYQERCTQGEGTMVHRPAGHTGIDGWEADGRRDSTS